MVMLQFLLGQAYQLQQVVNWKGLLKDLAEELGLDIEKEHDLIGVAQYHFNRHKRGKINNKIINEFTTLGQGGDSHKLLSKIGIVHFGQLTMIN